MTIFFAILFIITLVFFKTVEYNSNVKRRQLATFNAIKQGYFKSLKSNNISILDKLKLGMQYYSNKLNESNTDTVDRTYEKVASDIVAYTNMPEFQAILTIFFAAAYNPFKSTLYDDKRLKIAEILAAWKIDTDEIEPQYKQASDFIMLLKGKVDANALFKFIETNKHKSIILLATDIVFSGTKQETYQENFLNQLAAINPEAKKLIAESIVYYENRIKATSINWIHTEGEYQSVS